MAKEYAFDLKLDVALRVKAASFAKAVEILKEKLDCADANFGAWDNGEPITAEATLNGDVTPSMLFEIDGEEPTVCPGCDAIEGEEEWGTVGDGFDGYCGDCADKRSCRECGEELDDPNSETLCDQCQAEADIEASNG